MFTNYVFFQVYEYMAIFCNGVAGLFPLEILFIALWKQEKMKKQIFPGTQQTYKPAFLGKLQEWFQNT